MDGTRNPYDEEFLAQLAALRPSPPPGATYPVAPDPALAAATAERGQTDAAALLMDAAGYFNRAGGGSAPANMGDAVRRTRDDGINDLVRQRAMAAENAKAAEAERRRRIEIALDNAESPESMQAWDLIGRTTLAQRVPMLADARGKLPGKYAPGAKDLIAGEIDLAKAQIRAEGEAAGDGGIQEAINAYATAYADKNPRLKALADAAARTVDSQTKRAMLDKMNAELGRQQQSVNVNINDARQRDQFTQNMTQRDLQHDQRVLSQVRDDLDKSGAFEFTGAVNEIDRTYAALKKKYGSTNIPGLGRDARLAQDSSLYRKVLQPDDAKLMDNAVQALLTAKRHKAYGGNLTPQESVAFDKAVDAIYDADTFEDAIRALRRAQSSLTASAFDQIVDPELQSTAWDKLGPRTGMKRGKSGKLYYLDHEGRPFTMD